MVEQNQSGSAVYARALFQNGLTLENDKANSIKSNLISLGEELLLMRALIFNSLEVKIILTNPTIFNEKKLKILHSFFPQMSKVMLSFLRVLSEQSQLTSICEICEEYQKLLYKFSAITSVTLIVANPLEESLGPYLLIALKKLTASKEIILKPIFNPKLLGGLVIEYNSKIIDASIANQMYKFL